MVRARQSSSNASTGAHDETLKVAPKAPLFYLVHSLPDRATVRVALEPGVDVVFGRSPDVTVTIDDPRVSRRHALVRQAGGTVTVRDLGSSNGTVVRSESLHDAEARIGAGDVIGIGPLQAVLVSASERWVVADPAMRKTVGAVLRVARRDSPVLLLGEAGVGKCALAERIHDGSPRAEKPFVIFRCGSVPPGEVEASIFGPRGVLESAHQGSVLLADMEEMPRSAQEHLWRWLSTQASSRAATPDVRILCATRGDLRAAVAAGTFDASLYTLVATLAVRVPPLRERVAEIPVLAEHLLRRIAEPLGLDPPSLSPQAAKLLTEHPWTRNVSDLRDVMEYALALSDDGTIRPSDLPVSFTGGSDSAPSRPTDEARAVIRMQGEGDAFDVPPSPPVSLARRGSLRRVLVRLARERGRALSADDLFAAGWPGESSVGQSAEGRVRTAIWMLRRMGLQDWLITRDGGYQLSDHVTVEWRS